MTITVTQLNNYIHGVFDMDGTLSNVTVSGEVTNVKQSYNGWYFSLKDDQSAINCFCYNGATEPQSGDMVIVEGQVNYFTRSGSVSFFARRITDTKNTGLAYQQFVLLKEKLTKEGLFDPSRKKTVPHCCSKVGVVTSETGAVIHDIENVALRRQPFVNIFLYPVKVQGNDAAQEIAQGVKYFANTDVDVIIVGRGGGSNEDLSVFNDEIVVRAVASSPKPIVSAVGHGVDFTLCDFAADRRAVTPSEAAEFVTIDVASAKNYVYSSLVRIENAVGNKLNSYCKDVVYYLQSVSLNVNGFVENASNQIKNFVQSIERGVSKQCQANEHNLDSHIAKLSSLNPLNVLQRGFTYVNNGDNIVKSVADVNVEDKITLTVCDGKIQAKVLSKEKK
ncbi:MAG: exodeoxyribonuclease VII large subunit [Clostridia bacterium]|nr:exodeoxyribonuclease VII large subunit [Clostridia bacterium]